METVVEMVVGRQLNFDNYSSYVTTTMMVRTAVAKYSP